MRPKVLRNSQSEVKLIQKSLESPQVVTPSKEMEFGNFVFALGEHLKEGHEINKRLIQKL